MRCTSVNSAGPCYKVSNDVLFLYFSIEDIPQFIALVISGIFLIIWIIVRFKTSVLQALDWRKRMLLRLTIILLLLMFGGIFPIFFLCGGSTLNDIMIQLLATLELNVMSIVLTVFVSPAYGSIMEVYRDKFGGVTVSFGIIEWGVFIIAVVIQALNSKIEHSWFFLTFGFLGLAFDATLIFLSYRDIWSHYVIVLLSFDIIRNAAQIITHALLSAGEDAGYCFTFISDAMYYFFPSAVIFSWILLEYR